MNTLSSAVDKVEQALAAGRDVRIAYVYRDPVEALTGGAIPRAERQAVKFGSGRTVPLVEHAKTHIGVRPVMEALAARRSEEHTSELQSLMRISYAVFCLKKKNSRNQLTGKTSVEHKNETQLTTRNNYPSITSSK